MLIFKVELHSFTCRKENYVKLTLKYCNNLGILGYFKADYRTSFTFSD